MSESSSSSTVETLQPSAAARSSRTWLPVPVAIVAALGTLRRSLVLFLTP